MSLYASWVHGNAARVQFPGGAGLEFTNGSRMSQVENHAWTDIVGFPTGPGAVFRGAGDNPDTNYFHFVIPTPVVMNNQRLKVARVFVLFSSDEFVLVEQIYAFDGPRNLPVNGGLPSNLSGCFDGRNGLSDLIEGKTLFNIEGSPAILFGLGISVRVRFGRPGQITFTAAGADFISE